ncbi:sugar ABC transporter ATP-binding protein [Microbacterium sp.]|uniref:sugar ABC transporter ATP-binding protein n=1 Tax=Microbacterium sp. TaxID=51671 RepID=UPI0033404ED6
MIDPLLSMSGIGKSFSGVRALDGVSLTVQAGRVVALLGENGAGKSTLINVLSGVFPSYDGEIRMDGESIDLHSPAQAQRLGISTIHQELNLVPEMSIADNIFLGREIDSVGWVRRSRSVQHAQELLARVGLSHLDPRTPVSRCRLAEQQLVEVAKAISLDARVLIMDEPTSSLAEAEVQQLFTVIRNLTAAGVGIVFISHRLEELEEIADTVNVLRDGRWIGERPMEGVTREELISMMVGRDVVYAPHEPSDAGSRPVRLEISGLSLRGSRSESRAALHDVSLQVREGEVVGLAGLMGAGRTEILQAVFGAYPRRDVSGSARLDDRALGLRSPRHAITRGIALVAEDRKLQSLVLDESVRFNSALAALGRFARAGWIRPSRERAAVEQQVRRLGTKTPSIRVPVRNLSGGNQQKVVLGKWLLTEPRLILLDEPTRGIDIGAKAEIYAIVAELAAQGVSFLVASSELPELLTMCDRILVIREGEVSAEFDAVVATQEELLAAAMPVRPAPREEAA